MNSKKYFHFSAVVFGIIALLHTARLAQGWSASIDGWIVPMNLSWIALAVAGYLAYWGFKFSK